MGQKQGVEIKELGWNKLYSNERTSKPLFKSERQKPQLPPPVLQHCRANGAKPQNEHGFIHL